MRAKHLISFLFLGIFCPLHARESSVAFNFFGFQTEFQMKGSLPIDMHYGQNVNDSQGYSVPVWNPPAPYTNNTYTISAADRLWGFTHKGLTHPSSNAAGVKDTGRDYYWGRMFDGWTPVTIPPGTKKVKIDINWSYELNVAPITVSAPIRWQRYDMTNAYLDMFDGVEMDLGTGTYLVQYCYFYRPTLTITNQLPVPYAAPATFKWDLTQNVYGNLVGGNGSTAGTADQVLTGNIVTYTKTVIIDIPTEIAGKTLYVDFGPAFVWGDGYYTSPSKNVHEGYDQFTNGSVTMTAYTSPLKGKLQLKQTYLAGYQGAVETTYKLTP